MGYNKIILLGNVAKDIEIRKVGDNKSVCDIRLAVSEKRKSGDETLFMDCTCWEKTAELAAQYLAKGRQVLLEGRLRMQEWNDKESGQKRSKITMTVDKMVFVGGKSDAPVDQQRVQDTPPVGDTDVLF